MQTSQLVDTQVQCHGVGRQQCPEKQACTKRLDRLVNQVASASIQVTLGDDTITEKVKFCSLSDTRIVASRNFRLACGGSHQPALGTPLPLVFVNILLVHSSCWYVGVCACVCVYVCTRSVGGVLTMLQASCAASLRSRGANAARQLSSARWLPLLPTRSCAPRSGWLVGTPVSRAFSAAPINDAGGESPHPGYSGALVCCGGRVPMVS